MTNFFTATDNFDFEIFVNDRLIYSRQDTGVYPDENLVRVAINYLNVTLIPRL